MKKFSRTLAVLFAAVAMVLPGTVQAAPVAEEAVMPVERLAGTGRMQTAVEVSKVAYKEGADTVVVAGFNGEVDALTGTLLAHAKEAPVLVTEQNRLSSVTKNEIVRLGAKTVYLLGGETVVSAQVVSDLEVLDNVTVKRVSGKDRYETAHKVATEAKGNTTHVFLALGDVLADALSVGPVSAIKDRPVLLTTKNYIPQPTKEAMEVLGVTHVTIVGGKNAISENIKTELAKSYTVDRVNGTDRYETAKEIAKHYFTNPKSAIVTNDGLASYADALVGGYLGALKGAPILLTDLNSLSTITNDYMALYTDRAFVLGGIEVVTGTVVDQARKAVKDEIEIKETVKIDRNYKSVKVTGDKIDVDLNGKTVGKMTITSNDATIKHGAINNITVGKDVKDVTFDSITDDGEGDHQFEGGGSESIILRGSTQLESRINISSATPVQIRAEDLEAGKGMTGRVTVNTEAAVTIAAPVEELEVKKANKDIQIKAVVARVSALADVKITVAENIKTPKLEKARGVKATATNSKGKEEVFTENEKLEPTEPEVPVRPVPPASKPIEVIDVVITGEHLVGQTLIATPNPSKATGLYEWMRGDALVGEYLPVENAKERTYKLTSQDVGKYFKVKFTATGSYSGTIISDERGVIYSVEEEEAADKVAAEFREKYQYIFNKQAIDIVLKDRENLKIIREAFERLSARAKEKLIEEEIKLEYFEEKISELEYLQKVEGLETAAAALLDGEELAEGVDRKKIDALEIQVDNLQGDRHYTDGDKKTAKKYINTARKLAGKTDLEIEDLVREFESKYAGIIHLRVVKLEEALAFIAAYDELDKDVVAKVSQQTTEIYESLKNETIRTKVINVIEAVDNAESSRIQVDINNARVLLENLEVEGIKNKLEARLVEIEISNIFMNAYKYEHSSEYDYISKAKPIGNQVGEYIVAANYQDNPELLQRDAMNDMDLFLRALYYGNKDNPPQMITYGMEEYVWDKASQVAGGNWVHSRISERLGETLAEQIQQDINDLVTNEDFSVAVAKLKRGIELKVDGVKLTLRATIVQDKAK